MFLFLVMFLYVIVREFQIIYFQVAADKIILFQVLGRTP